jgi:hypothetical protein
VKRAVLKNGAVAITGKDLWQGLVRVNQEKQMYSIRWHQLNDEQTH